MLQKTAKFRVKRNYANNQAGVNTILTDFVPNEDFKTALVAPVRYCLDKDGGLVLFHRTGLMDGHYFCKYYSGNYLVDMLTYVLETFTQDAMAHMHKTGAPPYVSFVLDLTGPCCGDPGPEACLSVSLFVGWLVGRRR